ncbi:MAG: NAD(P)/FAD-dependent oxidoreductase, partial [Acidobacteria bacterium]|nr:NAD(P)/FAD-dependent oxidoreductase [Acidobacteriota bacterium]
AFMKLGRAVAPMLAMTPPDIDHLKTDDYFNLGKLGLRFRGLDKKNAYRLLRWGPMAVADLAAEWFETELLRAAVEARGIWGMSAGPWSAGTSIGLLLQAAIDGQAIAPASFVRGGIGALTQALAKAAASAGAQIRTGANVVAIRADRGRVSAVVLAGGEEIPASAVVSNADPRQTFLKLVNPADLDPSFLTKVQNYRCAGSAAKVNLALSGLPAFRAAKDSGDLSGRIHIGPDTDYLERAFDVSKYGGFAEQPYMDITIPSLTDPSLTPKGAHVMSIHVQYAPYPLKTGGWNARRDELGDAVINALSIYAPNLRESVVHRQVITPLDMDQTFGLTGGHLFHGEHSLDQLFAFRPFLGWARYRTPIQGLYLCGAGTHPGGGVTGAPGANASREIIKDLS